MNIFDEKFKTNKFKYITQCAMATIIVLVMMFVLGGFTHTVTIASLGATSFIIFTMPHKQVSRTRFVLGGHVVGISSAVICHYLADWSVAGRIPIVMDSSLVIFGALAVGMTMFFMVITDTEHPPAASLSLGLVIDEFHLSTIVVIFAAAAALILVKSALKKHLIDLL